MDLDVAALQSARSAVTVREFQTEDVFVAAGFAIVNYNNLREDECETKDFGSIQSNVHNTKMPDALPFYD